MSGLFKQSVLYSIGEIIPKLVSFLLLPVYTHYLTKSDYGVLNYTNSFVMFLFVLAVLSLNTFVLRCYFDEKSERDKKRLLGNIFIAIAIFNMIILILSYLFMPILIEKFNVQVPWQPYFKLAIINNFLEVFSVIPLVMYRVKQQARMFVFLSLSKTLLQMLLTFIFIAYLEWGVLGHYYGRLFVLIPFLFIYLFIISKNVEFNINLLQLKKALLFSFPLLPGALAYIVLSLSDRLILERFVSISELGIYGLACTLALTLNIVIQGFYKAVEPEIFKRVSQINFGQFINQIQSIFFAVVYLGAMVIALFSQEIFKIMASPEFYNGYLLIPILMIGVIMSGQNIMFGAIVLAEEKTKIIGMATIIGAIFSLCFNLLFIPYGGVYIAAISSAISFAIMSFILYMNISLKSKKVKSSIRALIVFVGITYLLFYVINIQFSLYSILLKILVLLLYVLFLVKNFKIDINIFYKFIYKKV